MTNEEYIAKWLDGTLSEEEKRTFEASEDFKEIEKMLKATQSFKAPDYDVQSELERFNNTKPKRGKVVKVNWVKSFIGVAASLLIIAAGYFVFFYESLTTYRALAGEKKEIYLPDSSYVLLNAGSALSYSGESWGEERTVELFGEGYFKVKKGSQFHVKTTTGKVSVLGTEFNVIQRRDYFEVFCYEGKVQVLAAPHTLPLTAGHGFRLADFEVSELTDLKLSAPSWIDGESYFQSVPYAHVVHELELQYNISIQTNNVDLDKLFTGGFTHSDLNLALSSVAIPLNLTVDIIDDSNIILSGD